MKSCNNNIRTASDGGQYKKVRARVLGKGTCSKNKLQSPPQTDRHRKLTITVAKRLGGQMGAAHRKYIRVRPNCQDLAIRKWNVSSLTGKEHKLVSKAQQYLLDIVGTSSTNCATVELNGGWKIFYYGVVAAMSAQAGVGLLVSPNIAVSMSLTGYHWEILVRICLLKLWVCLLKLKLQERSLSILQVYAPNMESQYEALLEEIEVALGKATSSELLVLLGDFNTHICIDLAT